MSHSLKHKFLETQYDNPMLSSSAAFDALAQHFLNYFSPFEIISTCTDDPLGGHTTQRLLMVVQMTFSGQYLLCSAISLAL